MDKKKHLPWKDTRDILSADNTKCFVHVANFVSEMPIQTDRGLVSNMQHQVSQRQLTGTVLLISHVPVNVTVKYWFFVLKRQKQINALASHRHW
jgi:hypothetical protein